MSEKTNEYPAELQNPDQKEHDFQLEVFLGLKQTYALIEKEGQRIASYLDTPPQINEADKSRVNLVKDSLELDELLIADVEKRIKIKELELGLDTQESIRFKNNDNDTLVNSVVFYADRIESLKSATGNQEIDKDFVDAIKEYAKAIKFDEDHNSQCGFCDVKEKQKYTEERQKTRSRLHNELIDSFNELNDLMTRNNLTPLTYRNFVKNSISNNFKNTNETSHDRVTVAHYVARMIRDNLQQDERLPDPKYVEQT